MVLLLLPTEVLALLLVRLSENEAAAGRDARLRSCLRLPLRWSLAAEATDEAAE